MINNDKQLVDIDSAMRPSGVTTCRDENKEVTGIKFHLSDKSDENGEEIELPLLGGKGEECKYLKLSKALDRIEASTLD